MAAIEYVGRKATFIGKSLPQICMKLKNFGVGRLFVRGSIEQKPDCVTYYILKKIEIDMNDPYMRKGIFVADTIKKNTRIGLENIPGYCEDFQLVSKEEEIDFIKKTLPLGEKFGEQKVAPKFVDLPPLLKLMLTDELKKRKDIQADPNDIKLPYFIRESKVTNVVQE